MSDKVFVDTNVLLYAYDLDAGDRNRRAVQAIRQLWDTGGAVISIQVLQEFYVNVTRKIADPLPPAEARRLIEAYRAWQVECPDTEAVLRASEIQERNRLSFWDAMIVATALQGGCDDSPIGRPEPFPGHRRHPRRKSLPALNIPSRRCLRSGPLARSSQPQRSGDPG